MFKDIERLKDIRKEMDSLWRIRDTTVYPTDKVRESYFFNEIESLMLVIDIAETKKYKQSLILIRSVFEKFLYFWLMFCGKRYRWTYPYRIIPRTSSSPREARDRTIESWRQLKKSGDPKYAKWEIQKARQENIIYLTVEGEGLYITRDGKETGEIQPIYNNMLTEYQPDIKHLSDIKNKISNLMDHENADELISYQNNIYNHYIYVTNIFRNLQINNLVDNSRLDIIRVHYNFLSKYVHPSKFSLEIWDDINNNYRQNPEKQKALKELILFYCTKLMQLYFGTYLSGYRNTKHVEWLEKFQSLVGELEEMTKEFWFFDNEPTPFDINYSENITKTRRATGNDAPDELIYNEDPLDRIILLRTYLPIS